MNDDQTADICSTCGAQGHRCSGQDDQGPEYDDWIGMSDGVECCHACYHEETN